MHLPFTKANPTHQPASLPNRTDFFTPIRFVALMEDRLCVTEIIRECGYLVGHEGKLDAHPMACSQFLLDFQTKAIENREEFCFRQFVRDAHSSTAGSEVDLIPHLASVEGRRASQNKKAGPPNPSIKN